MQPFLDWRSFGPTLRLRRAQSSRPPKGPALSLPKGPARLPHFAEVRQHFPDAGLTDVEVAVRQELERGGLRRRRRAGQRIAITAGSRGIDRLPTVLRAVVQAVKDAGAAPFVVAAMGSHGGATSEGQRQVLEALGITEETVGCPIVSDMAAVEIGRTEGACPEPAEGACPVFCDRAAYESDGIILVNRVKPHSILVGELGSGLLKMLVAGLGKHQGAAALHAYGLKQHLLPAARLTLQRAPVLLGLALVDNAHDRLCHVEAVRPEEMEEADRRLLGRARSSLPTIPFDPLDVLVVRRMGKDISGAGMDPNVIGMHRRLGGAPQRHIGRIVVLDLTPASHGNAIGVGMADVITVRLRRKINAQATVTNALTSDFLWGLKLPLTLPTDRAALAVAFKPFDPTTVRAVIIQDTAHLDRLWVSEALLEEAATMPHLEVVRGAMELVFDGRGRLGKDLLAKQ